MDGQGINLVRVEACDVLWRRDEGLRGLGWYLLIREQVGMRDALVKVVRDLLAFCYRRILKVLLFLLVDALETRLKPLVNLRDHCLLVELMRLVCLAQQDIDRVTASANRFSPLVLSAHRYSIDE